MLVNALHTAGLRSTHLQAASFGSIVLCLGLWTRAKTIDPRDAACRCTLRRPAACNALTSMVPP